MALTDLKIKSAAVGERHHDGRGLYLTLSAPGRGRNNITHRGKGGYDEDVPIIDASLDILSKTIKNLLTIKE